VPGEFVIRPYQPSEESKIIELLEDAFHGWPHFDLQCSPLDHWKWKYEDNPIKRKMVIVGESDNKIIGCSHGVYLRLKMGDRSMIAHQGADLAVQKKFRDKGVFTKMIDFKNEALKENHTNIYYVLSTVPIVTKHHMKLNRQQFPSPLQRLIKVRDINLHLKMVNSKNMMVKYGYPVLKAVNQLRYSLTPHQFSRSTPDFEISDVERFDERFDAFWNEIKGDYNFIVERDTSHLNWRYCDKRGGDYQIRQASKGGDVLGYVVLRVNKYNKEYPEGYIVDLLARPDRLDVAYALIRDADQWFTKMGVNIIQTIAIEGHPYENLFNRNNFLNDIKRLYLLYTPINLGEELTDFKNSPPSKLHFGFGDLDWI
jgi:predicted N-acetyltransferase YhbS